MQHFNIGDIVAFQTHPFFATDRNIVISGDSSHIPPLMVIVEVLQKRVEQNVRREQSNNFTFHYHCLWFSTKNNKFQDAWLYHSQLKLIAVVDGQLESIERNSQVTLKTLDIELDKKRSAMSVEEQDQKVSSHINALLSFLPPLMQVKDLVTKTKDERVNKKKPQGVRKESGQVAKCIWYDHSHDKFSEVELPIEALTFVPIVSSEMIETIGTAIRNNQFFHCNDTGLESLVKPHRITARSGKYYLRAYDYVSNSVQEFRIADEVSFSLIETPFKNSAPTFDHDTESIVDAINDEIIAAINKARQNSSYLRIQYKNRNERVSIRTLANYEIKKVREREKEILFLVGYCFLRSEQRTFRLERIQNVQELNLTVPTK